MVDYLQIISPCDPRATDKQNVDRTVVELKRLSRDLKSPVLAISSFNRDAYNKQASMASAKESGAIEYGCDVLLALQPKAITGGDYNEQTEKRKTETAERVTGSTITIILNLICSLRMPRRSQR